VVISESIAILEYIEERFPSPALMPSNVTSRAIARQLMCWGTDYWPLAWKKWMAPRLADADWTDASVLEGRREIAAHLDVLDAQLGEQEWLVGSYSLADVSYAPLVLVLNRVGLGDEIATRPAIARWVERLRSRPAVKETMMPGDS
jgi:glutathione S-transferase